MLRRRIDRGFEHVFALEPALDPSCSDLAPRPGEPRSELRDGPRAWERRPRAAARRLWVRLDTALPGRARPSCQEIEEGSSAPARRDPRDGVAGASRAAPGRASSAGPTGAPSPSQEPSRLYRFCALHRLYPGDLHRDGDVRETFSDPPPTGRLPLREGWIAISTSPAGPVQDGGKGVPASPRASSSRRDGLVRMALGRWSRRRLITVATLFA